jgi:hypothetical protein
MTPIGTWLYLKKHNQTGLLYFGKTVRNPLKYKGSGSYWSSHRKIHGNDISTVWCELFEDNNKLVEFAEFVSDFFEIVTFTANGKKLWANEVPENGLMGGQNKGQPSKMRGKKLENPSPLRGIKRPNHSNLMKGRKLTNEHSANISKSLKKHTRTKEHSLNISLAKKGKKLSSPRICNVYECPHCGKIGKGPNMKRYHFNNCKRKEHNG